MRKNSITRFNSENIAYVDFDTDTKEGVAGIFDEVNGQDYPFSGGGGFNNPICTVTLVLSEGDTNLSYLYRDENVLTLRDAQYYFEGDATYTLDLIIPLYDEGWGTQSYKWYINDLAVDMRTKTVTDEVNCTVTFGEGFGFILVTDGTQNASCTITLS